MELIATSVVWTLFFMFENALDSRHWQKRKSLEGRCNCILDEDTKEHPSMHCLQILKKVAIALILISLWFFQSKKLWFFPDESKEDIAQMIRCRSVQHLCWHRSVKAPKRHFPKSQRSNQMDSKRKEENLKNLGKSQVNLCVCVCVCT